MSAARPTTPVAPTFVVAGGQRCGTTMLYHLLDEHPQIYMAKPVRPEPKFFLREPVPPHDKEWYLRTWFSGVGPEHAIGEKSTSYMEVAETPRRMKALFPDLKVVFILRHPVERAISNYLFSRANGFETLPLEEAMAQEPSRLGELPPDGLSASPHAYIHRGRYDVFLARFLEYFEPDRLKILLNDDLEALPGLTCQDLYRFLGVAPEFRPRTLEARHNASDRGGIKVSQRLYDKLSGQFEESIRRLEALLGRDLEKWKRPSPTIQELMGSETSGLTA